MIRTPRGTARAALRCSFRGALGLLSLAPCATTSARAQDVPSTDEVVHAPETAAAPESAPPTSTNSPVFIARLGMSGYSDFHNRDRMQGVTTDLSLMTYLARERVYFGLFTLPLGVVNGHLLAGVAAEFGYHAPRYGVGAFLGSTSRKWDDEMVPFVGLALRAGQVVGSHVELRASIGPSPETLVWDYETHTSRVLPRQIRMPYFELRGQLEVTPRVALVGRVQTSFGLESVSSATVGTRITVHDTETLDIGFTPSIGYAQVIRDRANDWVNNAAPPGVRVDAQVDVRLRRHTPLAARTRSPRGMRLRVDTSLRAAMLGGRVPAGSDNPANPSTVMYLDVDAGFYGTKLPIYGRVHMMPSGNFVRNGFDDSERGVALEAGLHLPSFALGAFVGTGTLGATPDKWQDENRHGLRLRGLYGVSMRVGSLDGLNVALTAAISAFDQTVRVSHLEVDAQVPLTKTLRLRGHAETGLGVRPLTFAELGLGITVHESERTRAQIVPFAGYGRRRAHRSMDYMDSILSGPAEQGVTLGVRLVLDHDVGLVR